ncbi:MAG: hypothetical protein AAFX81_15940 [Pseudomonadota bacterium]
MQALAPDPPDVPDFAGDASLGGSAADAAQQNRTFRAAKSPRRFIYGEGFYAGQLRAAWSYGPKREWLCLVHVLASHAIAGFGGQMTIAGQQVHLELSPEGWYRPAADQPYHSADPLFQTVIFSDPTEASAFLTYVAEQAGQSPWTDQHIGRGLSFAVSVLRWDNGETWRAVPEFRWLVQGRLVYDPRTGTDRYTSNLPLVIGDYLSHPFGCGIPREAIETAQWSDAASIADEMVALRDGGTDPRYRYNGTIFATENRRSVLTRLADHMVGAVFELSNGQWLICPGADDAPVDLTLSLDDMAGPLQVRAGRPTAELYNEGVATYVDAATAQEVETPTWPAEPNPFVVEDLGRRVRLTKSFQGARSAETAQRLLAAHLQVGRRPVSLSGTFKLRAAALRPWHVVRFTHDRLGWLNKPFRVTSWAFDPERGVELALREHEPAAWDWDEGAALTVPTVPATRLAAPVLDSTARQAGGSLVLNGHFEQELAGWTASVDQGVTWRAAGGYSSSAAAVLRAYGPVAEIASTPVPIEPGAVYSAGAWVRRDAPTAEGPGANFAIRWLDAAGGQIGVYTRALLSTETPPAGAGWVGGRLPIMAPPTARQAVVALQAHGAGAVLFDDAWLAAQPRWSDVYGDGRPDNYATDTQPGTNLVSNGGGERGDAIDLWFSLPDFVAGAVSYPYNKGETNPLWQSFGGYFSGSCWGVIPGSGYDDAVHRYVFFAGGGAVTGGLHRYKAGDVYSFRAKVQASEAFYTTVSPSVLLFDGDVGSQTQINLRDVGQYTVKPDKVWQWADIAIEFTVDDQLLNGNSTKWFVFGLGLMAWPGRTLRIDDAQFRLIASREGIAAGAVYQIAEGTGFGDIGPAGATVAQATVQVTSYELEVEISIHLDNINQAVPLSMNLFLFRDGVDVTSSSNLLATALTVPAGQTLQHSDALKLAGGVAADQPPTASTIALYAIETAGQSASMSQAYKLKLRARQI